MNEELINDPLALNDESTKKTFQEYLHESERIADGILVSVEDFGLGSNSTVFRVYHKDKWWALEIDKKYRNVPYMGGWCEKSRFISFIEGLLYSLERE
jgi:hypothetical protein